VTRTGQLGDVMKESAQIALSYLRSDGAVRRLADSERPTALSILLGGGAQMIHSARHWWQRAQCGTTYRTKADLAQRLRISRCR
jgi:hypothetical protein